MGLDLDRGLGLGGLGLDDVGVERALGQEVDLSKLAGLLLEDPDELVADDAPLLLRILHALEPAEESVSGVEHHQLHAQVLFERCAQQLRLALAHQAVVDVDAGELVAHGAMHQRGRHRRVDPARERTDHPSRSNAVANLGDVGLHEARRCPGLSGTGDIDNETAQDLPAVRRVDDLGVELDPVQVPLWVRKSGKRG